LQGNNNILTLARAKLLVAIIILTSILLGIIPALSAKVESIPEDVQAYMSNQSNSTAAPLPEHYSICYIELQSNIGYLSRITKSFLDVIYAIAIVVITILYALIYKGVYTRRKKKRERTHALLMSSYRNGRSMNSHELSRFPHRPSKLLQVKISFMSIQKMKQKFCD
jgi:Kef-type K+ transport system membrane component KefB